MNVTQASEILWEQGERILQGNRFADTSSEHLEKLVDYMRLTGREKYIADMGCGFGEVSKFMWPLLPKAYFWLVNNNEYQLSKCKELEENPRFLAVNMDMTKTKFKDNGMDLVMFNYSLCHADHKQALEEANRITARYGKLFIYDYARIRGDNSWAKEYLDAEFHSDQEFYDNCRATGWHWLETVFPQGDDTKFRQAMGDDTVYDKIFNDVVPVIWRATKP